MSYVCKVIAFDLDDDSLVSLREAIPDSLVELIKGATAASLDQEWDPGMVDLVVVNAVKDVAETMELCRFLVSCGVLAGAKARVATDSEEELPKSLGRHRYRPHVGRRPHAPLLVLLPPAHRNNVDALLKAGAHTCLVLPINAKNVVSMLHHAQAGNRPGRHTLDLERAQTEDRWRDDGGQG